VFSTRDDAIVFETNVEAFVRVEAMESPPETETNFVPLNCVHKTRKPLSVLSCPCRLDDDLVADQHTRAFLGETRHRKARKSINFQFSVKDGKTNKWNGCRYSILASGISNFSRSRLDTHQFDNAVKHRAKTHTKSYTPHTKAAPRTFECMFQVLNAAVKTPFRLLAQGLVEVCAGKYTDPPVFCTTRGALSTGQLSRKVVPDDP
jgi:hypothetical protein